MRFANRQQAGIQLGERLAAMDLADPLVIGMARGGVPVAAEVARVLGVPFDVAVVRKIGAPHQPEAAIGAIAEQGARVINERAVRALGLSDEDVDALAARESAELNRRLAAYRDGRPAPDVTGRTVVLVDDGLATGMTALAAAESMRLQGAARVVLAVPVCAAQAQDEVPDGTVNELVCLYAPDQMLAVSMWYENFAQTTDEEVMALLA